MPELPEIETVKLQLQKQLVGQQLTAIEALNHKSLHGKKDLVEGKRIVEVGRKGKMLVIDLEEDLVIAIHFKMSGQLILIRSSKFKAHSQKESFENRIVGGHPTLDWVGNLPSKHTRVIFHFQSGDIMYFNDQRLFGWVKIVTQRQLLEMPFVKKLGPEIWDISAQKFYELLHKKKKAIKVAIMEQDLLSGVGNIYANDGLWEAKIHPKTLAYDLTPTQVRALQKGIITVLKDGITYGGATAADGKYMDLQGLGGHYQDHFRTYHRTNEKCLRNDGGVIKKITLGGRGTYFCPVCQPER